LVTASRRRKVLEGTGLGALIRLIGSVAAILPPDVAKGMITKSWSSLKSNKS
jgi:hypothetical protein